MPGNVKHHSDKWHKCWQDVQDKGHSAESAAAICTASIQGAGEDIYASENAPPDDGKPVNWPAYTLGKPFKFYQKKKKDKGNDTKDKPKWTPPWLKK